jgi:cytochrome P450
VRTPRSSSPAPRRKSELPPTPPLPGIVQTLACRWMPLNVFEWCRRHNGDRFTLYPVDMAPVVFLSDPDDVRSVLHAPESVLHPGAGGAAISPIVGEHSFMLREADEHMIGRKAILPAFSASAIESHIAMVNATATREVASWPMDSPFAVHERLRSMSLSIILRTVFQHERAELAALHQHMLAMLDVTASFVLIEPRLRRLPVWRGIWRRFIKDRELVDREIHTLVRSGRTTDSGSGVLDKLLAARDTDGSPMTDGQLRDNLVSVILAGHETTASQLAWALQLLAHHPEAQERLAVEILTGDGEGYLMATIHEVLRHRPVFLFAIPRVVAKPIVIGGWTYRPPTQLLACIYLVQHDPNVHSEPDEFRPERFLGASPAPAGYLPWGGGRKRCPGHRLATLEMQALLRATLATRTIRPAARRPERARWRSVIVTPRHGGRLVLSQRPTADQTASRVPR